MSKRMHGLRSILIAAALASGCVVSAPFTASPGAKQLVVLLEVNWAGDGRLRLRDRNSGRSVVLGEVAFSDDNVRLVGFTWSADGRWFGWIEGVQGESVVPTRLVVVDVGNFPEHQPKVLLDRQEDAYALRLDGEQVHVWNSKGEARLLAP